MTRRWILGGLMIGLALGSTGCRHLCKRGICSSRNDPPRARDDLFIPPPTGGLPSTRPAPSDAALPPATIPSEPSDSRFRPQRETLYPDPLLESPAIGGNKANEPPPVLTIPDAARRAPEPAKSPTGLPGFAIVRDRIATGRKPTLDGFDTLRSTGYKTVVYLHAPGREVAATRDLAEKKGLAFRSLAVEPTGLKAATGSFAEIVGDASLQPLYVFDDDGLRTGMLWYLHLRTIEALPDDAAQVKAAALGLRDASGDEKTNFWLAVQEYLTKR
jgi:hypothetical protein